MLSCTASAINDSGDVVGTYIASVQQATLDGGLETVHESRTFLFQSVGGSFTDLGVLGRGDSG